MQLHGWAAIIFYILAFSTLIMGVLVVSSREAIHAALFLLGTVVNVAMLFILLRAELAAGAQLLIYAGGVVLLFLFVLMFRRPRPNRDDPSELYTKYMWLGVLLALTLAGSFFFAMNPAQPAFRPSSDFKQSDPSVNDTKRELAGAGASISNDTQNVGETLYKQGMLPFEVISVLLLATVIGATLLARQVKHAPSPTESEIAAAEDTTEPESPHEGAEVIVMTEEVIIIETGTDAPATSAGTEEKE
jgi:NADH-quinone oxidoreductase subunit J